MVAKLKIFVLIPLAMMTFAPACAGGTSYAVVGGSTPPSPDPLGDSILTSKFDPAPLVDLLGHTGASDQRVGLDSSDTNSFALKPIPSAPLSPSDPVERRSNRVGVRINGRMATRIDNHGGATPDLTDPRDRIGTDPADRVNSVQNAYNTAR